MSHHRHVMPEDDLIGHVDSSDCICQPQVQHVTDDDGSTVGWVHVHSSLDGRERPNRGSAI